MTFQILNLPLFFAIFIQVLLNTCLYLLINYYFFIYHFFYLKISYKCFSMQKIYFYEGYIIFLKIMKRVFHNFTIHHYHHHSWFFSLKGFFTLFNFYIIFSLNFYISKINSIYFCCLIFSSSNLYLLFNSKYKKNKRYNELV